MKAKKTEANLPEKKTVLIEEFFMSCRHVEKAPPNRYDTQQIDNYGCNYAANRSTGEFGLIL
ncbi:hypothetical protein [Stomatobaculum longum]|uniref:hypothetical protein n=1 Tax=Stomatobaculum longum TaxID=796942 RepID=UPI0028042007|nr:hypothetical protein [Stomatobaculum longum]